MIETQKLRWVTLLLTIIGFIDSSYLTWIKYSQNRALCFVGGGACWSVNNSIYSEWLGIPIAIFGMLGYLAIFILLLLENKVEYITTNGILIIFGLSLVGVVYSCYLTYIEIYILKSICPFCMLSAILMISTFIITIIRLRQIQLI
jgi:uncharacterized membrane protein